MSVCLRLVPSTFFGGHPPTRGRRRRIAVTSSSPAAVNGRVFSQVGGLIAGLATGVRRALHSLQPLQEQSCCQPSPQLSYALIITGSWSLSCMLNYTQNWPGEGNSFCTSVPAVGRLSGTGTGAHAHSHADAQPSLEAARRPVDDPPCYFGPTSPARQWLCVCVAARPGRGVRTATSAHHCWWNQTWARSD